MGKSNKDKAEKAMTCAQQLQKLSGKDKEQDKPVATPARAAEGSKPARRIIGKRAADVAEAVELAKKGKTAPPPEPEVDFEVSWDNIDRVMEKFNINERQATQVLLQVVGPNPAGKRFWDGYKKRIGEETKAAAVKTEPRPVAVKRELETEAPESQRPDTMDPPPDSQFPDTQVDESADGIFVPPQAPKRRRLKRLIQCDMPDQCDDEPDEYAEQTETEDEADDPDALDGEPLSDEEVVKTGEQTGGDGPSPDSGSGAIAAEPEIPQQVCVKQPVEPEEPVRPVPADPSAVAASQQLAESQSDRMPPARLQSRTASEYQRQLQLGVIGVMSHWASSSEVSMRASVRISYEVLLHAGHGAVGCAPPGFRLQDWRVAG